MIHNSIYDTNINYNKFPFSIRADHEILIKIDFEEKTDQMYENILSYYFYEFTTPLSSVPK